MNSFTDAGASPNEPHTSGDSRAQIAYRTLRHLIRAGRFRPDELVSEQQLAEEVGVGRTPIRDAVSRLEHEGLLERLPKRGLRIRSLTIEELHDLYQLREWMEVIVVRSAIRTLSDTELERIQGILDTAAAAVEAGCSWLDYRDLDLEFHSALWQATENRRAIDFLGSLHDAAILDLSYQPRASMPQTGLTSIRDHTRILRAVMARDVDAAEQAVVEHTRAYQATLADRIFGVGRWRAHDD